MTAPLSLLERIAQVIDPNAFASFSGPHWDGRKAYALAKAREILEAAQDCDAGSPAMLAAGRDALFGISEDPTIEAARACWHAMIAAALAEPIPSSRTQ